MKVVSYSWFWSPECNYPHSGQRDFYAKYAEVTPRVAALVYAGWEIRIHVARDMASRHMPQWEQLAALPDEFGNVKIIDMQYQPQLCEGMLWRMIPAWDPSVEAFICRDLDALPSPREKCSVDAWIASGTSIHTISDSRSHPVGMIMGGTCGFRPACLGRWPSFQEYIREAASRVDLSRHGADQEWHQASMAHVSSRRKDSSDTLPDYSCPLDHVASHIGSPYAITGAMTWLGQDRKVEQMANKVLFLSSTGDRILRRITRSLWEQLGWTVFVVSDDDGCDVQVDTSGLCRTSVIRVASMFGWMGTDPRCKVVMCAPDSLWPVKPSTWKWAGKGFCVFRWNGHVMGMGTPSEWSRMFPDVEADISNSARHQVWAGLGGSVSDGYAGMLLEHRLTEKHVEWSEVACECFDAPEHMRDALPFLGATLADKTLMEELECVL